MNPFVESYVKQLQGLVHELADMLEEYDTRLIQTQEAREKTLRQYWSAGRQISAMQETLERMPDLESDNVALERQLTEAVDRARRILEFTKALSGAIQQ